MVSWKKASKSLILLILIDLILFQSIFATVSYVAAAQTYSLVVRVRDEEINPVEGASVYLDGEYMGKTNVEGELKIYKVAEGKHLILVIKEGYQDEEVTVSVTSNTVVTVTLKPTPPPLPDLTVLELYLSNHKPVEGEEVVVGAAVANVGEGDAGGFSVSFRVDGKEFSSLWVGMLSAGGETKLGASWVAEVVGSHEISVVVDPKNEIEESDEGNNELTETIEVIARVYTLQVRVLDQEKNPIEGASVYLDGEFMGKTDSKGELLVEVAEGTHLILVKAEGYKDQERKVDVTSDRLVLVILEPTPPTKLPDLTIKEVSFKPSEPRAGEPVQVAVTIENVGLAAAKAFHWSWTPYPGAKPITGYVEAGLDAGAHTTVYASFTYKEAGGYATTAVADSENEVEEADEGNNAVVVTIIVTKPLATYTLTVWVLDFDTGDPIEGAAVYLDDEIVGLTSVAGEVVIRGVVEGAHLIQATKKGYQYQEKEVSVTSDMEIRMMLEPVVLPVPLPNLAALYMGLSSYQPIRGEEVEVEAFIINEGNGEAGSFSISFQVDGEEFASERIEELSPGERKTIEFAWIAVGFGDRELTLVIDSNNEVVELNEEDNTQTQRLQVKMMRAPLTPWMRRGEPPPEPPFLPIILAPIEAFYISIYDIIDNFIHLALPKPDLVVTEIVQDYVETGGIVTPLQPNWNLGITIKNVGEAEAAGPFIIGVFIRIEEYDYGMLPDLVCDETLLPGESYTFTIEEDQWMSGLQDITRFWFGRSEMPRMVVKVDVYDDILERFEFNNERSGQVPIAYVSGEVRDADGCPINDATIVWSGMWGVLNPWYGMVSDSDGYYRGILIAKPPWTMPISTEEYPEGRPPPTGERVVGGSAIIRSEDYPWLDQMNAYGGAAYGGYAPYVTPGIVLPPGVNTIDIELVYRSPNSGDVDGAHHEVEKHLAEVYNPIFRFDRDESFFPADPERYIENSKLWAHARTARYTVAIYDIIHDSPAVGHLQDYVTSYRGPASPTFLSLDREQLTWEDFLGPAPGTSGKGASDPTVYAQAYTPDYSAAISPNDLEYKIIYNLFYEYNPHPDFPDHEGDWQGVSVYVRRGEITHMVFGKHGFNIHSEMVKSGQVLKVEDPDNPGYPDPDFLIDVPGSEVEIVGRRPVVYVAMGSHASYHRQGVTTLRFIGVRGNWKDEVAACANTGKYESFWIDISFEVTREYPNSLSGRPLNEGAAMAGTDYHRGNLFWDGTSYTTSVLREPQPFNVHLIPDSPPQPGTLDYDLTHFQGKWGRDWVFYTVEVDAWGAGEIIEAILRDFYGAAGIHYLSPGTPGWE